MIALHTVGSLHPEGGGPSRTVPALVDHIRQVRPSWAIQIETNPFAIADSCAAAPRTLLHDHGQWAPINHASASCSRRFNLHRIVSPRGMLSPWALRHKSWKKWLAWRIYARRDLEQAAAIHATSDLECRELRDLGVRQPIAVIPNGVGVISPLPADAQRPEKPYALFLSRIHRKKGVAELLSAWEMLAPKEWELILAGPDEEGLMNRGRLPAGVRYVGMIDGAPKEQLMQQASLFVLPTYSENFGVVVAESLMAGVPVITTHGAPWECLAIDRCGWWIPMEPPILRDTLQIALGTPAEELREMGCRGRALVEERFTWPAIAKQMVEVYEWVLGGGIRPAYVHVD